MKTTKVWTVSASKLSITDLISQLPQVDVLVLNSFEAEQILQRRLNTYADIQTAAQRIVAVGAKNVLLTGEAVHDPLFSQDHWTNGQDSFWLASLRSPHVPSSKLATSILNTLTLGYSIQDAMVIAKMHTHPENTPEKQIDLPYLSSTPLKKLPMPFKAYATGFYPIVDNSLWVEKLLPLGVQCIQLRIKGSPTRGLEKEIKRSVFLAKKHKATLFVNDHWELAIQQGADGVHLGQDDLHSADLDAIHQSGLYLGISTHCYYEVARAHAIHPSYMACGPIFPTTSKIMPFKPQGIEGLQSWRKTLNYPLVAIGGVNLERLPSILATGVEGIALISAITKATDPEHQTQQFLKKIREYGHG